MLVNFDELTEVEDESVFKVEQMPIKSYEKLDTDVQVDITFERNLNLQRTARDGYTVLDWFSDIGGIQGILVSFAAILLGIWNYQYLENFMAQQLYRIENQNAAKHAAKDLLQRSRTVQMGTFSGCRSYMCNWVPNCCRCCSRTRDDLGMEIAREKLDKELNIIKIV